MPASKSRHPHKHVHPPHPVPASDIHPKKKANRIVIIMVLFLGVLGLCIGLFIDATNITTVLISTILGTAAGFLSGSVINKSLSGK